ncbi:MAG: TetR/AcrR family transcriptional regulator [Candidatus Nanopelagicales bacterium]
MLRPVKSEMHQTKKALLDTVLQLLESKPADQIAIDEVLQVSGISKGSLYHHYEDYPDLVEDALVFRYARYVDLSMDLMGPILSEPKNKSEFFESLKVLTRKTQSDKNARNRQERAELLGHAGHNERLKRKLGSEQKRLTDELNSYMQLAVDKGFFDESLDTEAAALFIQTYTLGLILNDIAEVPLEKDRWNEHIDRVLSMAFISKS